MPLTYTPQLLSRVRTAVEEATASFYTDAEIYQALTDGQRQVANYLHSLWLKSGKKVMPKGLTPLVLHSSGTTSEDSTGYVGVTYVTITNMWELISAFYSGDSATLKAQPCEIREYDKDFTNMYMTTADGSYNSFMTATLYRPYAFVKTKYASTYDVSVFFLPPKSGTAGVAYYTYLKFPTAIDGSTEPILAQPTHDAIAQYAIAFILNKDERTQESQFAYAQFEKMLQVLE